MKNIEVTCMVCGKTSLVSKQSFDADTSYLQSIHDFFKSTDLSKGATP